MSPKAATTNRTRRRILIGSALVVAVIALLVGSVVYPQWSSWRQIKRKQSALVFETDHAALLAACREVWENRSAFGNDDAGYIPIDPSDSKLPRAILALDAHAIDVFPSGLNIELGGQWCHYGFETFFDDKPDEKRTVWKSAYPSEELVPRLWFYAENGLPQRK
jgi:hypothetical protein